MKQEDINSFIEHNLKNFSVNSTGWNHLIRQMLFEFAIGGWNMNNNVFGKEKSGELRCYSYSENEELNTAIRNIKDKYLKLSLKTCEICGSEGKMRTVGSWQTTLCLNHYLEQQPVIEIDKELNIRFRNKTVLNLKDLSKAEIEYDLQGLRLYPKESDEYFYFSWQEPNYYLLLKTVPLHLFPEDRRNDISELFSSLQPCEICGYKALHCGCCLRCHNESWKESRCFIEDYGKKSDYIKACQMDIFLDEDDNEKYFKHDRSFAQFPGHQILFRQHDLREYEKLLF